jgi:hypothetical protein
MRKHLGNWTLGTLWMKLDHKIKINLQDIGCEVRNWKELAHNHVQCKALLSLVLNLKVLLTETES